MRLDDPNGRHPGGSSPVFGRLERGVDWARYWQNEQDSLKDHPEMAIPMMAFFEQIPPWRFSEDEHAQFELYRRGGRGLDLSAALAAGRLIVCGTEEVDGDTTKTPLPVPLLVSDVPVQGNGTTIVMYVLPLDRSAVTAPPTTEPSNQ